MDSTNIYSPSIIINIFNNRLGAVEEEQKVIEIEGLYIKLEGKGYKGLYNDKIVDFNTEQSITLSVPKMIRETLITDRIYSMKGYLTRSISDYGNIRIIFNVTKVLDSGKVNDEEEISKFVLKNDKVERNYKNFRMVIENILLNGNKPKFIIFQDDESEYDIANNLGEERNNFAIETYNISNMSTDEFFDKIKKVENDSLHDAIILNLSNKEIYKDTNLLELICDLKCMIVTVLKYEKGLYYIQGLVELNVDSVNQLDEFLIEISSKTNKFKKARLNELNKLDGIIATQKKELNDIKTTLNNQLKNSKDEANKNKRLKNLFGLANMVLVVILIICLKIIL